MSRTAIIEYLRVPPRAPWRWAEDARVLAWRDGSTVAFRGEIDLIIERLGPTGLPPFTSLAVLLAACRGLFPDIPGTAPPAPGLDAAGQFLLSLRNRQNQQLREALVGVSRLPDSLLGKLEGKAVLASAVFENTPRLSTAESEAVVRGLGEPVAEDEINRPVLDAPRFDMLAVAGLVAQGLHGHTAESLERRLRTGLDALPLPAGRIELPRSELARRLFSALREHPELEGVASVARDLMAALRLPRTMRHVDESASGGVSDIGNRGSPDRLLITELAQDDLTLAARVALNEALYLRREPPTHRPDHTLVVLLDSGIRMWGIPRVLGLAASLALTTRHPDESAALVWRARGDRVEPVDLFDPRGIEAHLAALEVEAHPGAALPAWQRELDACVGDVDAVIVTQRDVLDDPGFRARVSQLVVDRAYALVVDRDGTVCLHPLPWGSARPLATATVDVARLMSDPSSISRKRDASLRGPGDGTDLPACFFEPTFPLLLPVDAKMEATSPAAFEGPHGGVCVTSDRRLLSWKDFSYGARQHATDLPPGMVCHLGVEDGSILLIRSNSSDGMLRIMRVPLDGGSPGLTSIQTIERPTAVFRDREIVCVVLGLRVLVISLRHDEILADVSRPNHATWIRGRFYSVHGRLGFVNWTGTTVEFSETSLKMPGIVATFDRGEDGPCALSPDGQLHDINGNKCGGVGFIVGSVRYSVDGQRVFIGRDGTPEWYEAPCAGFRGRASLRPVHNMSRAQAGHVTPPTRSLLKKLSAIQAVAGQPIRLRKRGGTWLEFFRDPKGDIRIVAAPTGIAVRADDARVFQPITTPRRLGCSLRQAVWTDGRRAWLDTRGLLHLQPAGTSEGEVTIALAAQAPVAVWCNDGARCGPRFFHGPDAPLDADRAWAHIEAFGTPTC